MHTLAHHYDPVEKPESGVFTSAPKATTEQPENLREARAAIYSALIVLANAAGRLGGGR